MRTLSCMQPHTALRGSWSVAQKWPPTRKVDGTSCVLVFPCFSKDCAKYLRRRPGQLKRALCAAAPATDRAAAYRCAYAFEQPKRLRVVLREGCLPGGGTAALDSANEHAGREPARPQAAATSSEIAVLGAPQNIPTVNLLAVGEPAAPRCEPARLLDYES